MLWIVICPMFVCFVALRPKSTAMIMAGRSVHFLGKLEQAVNQYFMHLQAKVCARSTGQPLV